MKNIMIQITFHNHNIVQLNFSCCWSAGSSIPRTTIFIKCWTCIRIQWNIWTNFVETSNKIKAMFLFWIAISSRNGQFIYCIPKLQKRTRIVAFVFQFFYVSFLASYGAIFFGASRIWATIALRVCGFKKWDDFFSTLAVLTFRKAMPTTNIT